MSMTYAQWKTQLATMLAVKEDNAKLNIVLPDIIDYAEQRVYRELDLLSTIVRDTTGSLTANSRNFTLPQGTGRFVVTSGFNVLNASGVRTAQLEPVSLEWMDASYPLETATSASAVPAYFAMVTDQTIVVGPAPGYAWGMETIGEIRPAPLSSTNTTTYLTLYLPDVFFAASMIFGAGYQRDFGAQSDDKQLAVSWETQYQTLVASANIEEHRKKWQSVSWTSKNPSPIALPQRG